MVAKGLQEDSTTGDGPAAHLHRDVELDSRFLLHC